MIGDEVNGRVMACTALLTLGGLLTLFALAPPMPDGLAVLSVAGTFAVAFFLSLCAFAHR